MKFEESYFSAESLKRVGFGVVLGALVAFSWSFSEWKGIGLNAMIPSSYQKYAQDYSVGEVAKSHALACAKGIQARADASELLTLLAKADKANSSWDRRRAFPGDAQGLITLPGETSVSAALADACTKLVLMPKTAAK
jgi:hypothetical protein